MEKDIVLEDFFLQLLKSVVILFERGRDGSTKILSPLVHYLKDG